MPEALIKGETHSSKKDRQSLLNRDFSEYDAVFREGYDKDYFQRTCLPRGHNSWHGVSP